MNKFIKAAAFLKYLFIEETFRDLKSLLTFDKLMNKSQVHMEQMAVLVLRAFTIGFLVGEALRDEPYGAPASGPAAPGTPPPATESAESKARRKWQRYSGLFIVLKRKLTLAAKRLRLLHNQVVVAFAQLVQPLPVRT